MKKKPKPILIYIDNEGNTEISIGEKIHTYKIPYGQHYWVLFNFNKTPYKVINFLKRYEVKGEKTQVE